MNHRFSRSTITVGVLAALTCDFPQASGARAPSMVQAPLEPVVASASDDESRAQTRRTSGQLWATWNALRGDPYALDELSRSLPDGQRLHCDGHALVAHSVGAVRYRTTAWVNPAFGAKLEQFEEIARETAFEIYGRAPVWLVHFGAYCCRPTRHHSSRLSEHALGNALDVAGFDFGPTPHHGQLPAGLPPALRGAFRVRVAKHWNPPGDDAIAAVHSHFLHELTARSEKIFRVMIGPSQRDHGDHFHFDMSPWRYENL